MRLLLILALVILFYKLQEYFYKKKCFENLNCGLKFDFPYIFEGDRAELTETLHNNKLMPLWWVTADYKIPASLQVEDFNEDGNDYYLLNVYSLLSYQKHIKKWRIRGMKRGFYQVTSLDTATGDFMGGNKMIKKHSVRAEIHVFCKLIPAFQLKIIYKKLLGDVIVKRHLLEDPFRLRGIREYTPFDSFKFINWSASAKSGELKVNQYDFTVSLEILLFLDITVFYGKNPDRLTEESIRLANSLAYDFIQQGIPVGFRTNGPDCITGERISVGQAGNFSHCLTLCKAFSRLNKNSTDVPISAVMREESLKQNKEPIWIVISQNRESEMIDLVDSLRKQNYIVKFIVPKEKDVLLDLENRENLFVWEI